MKSVIGSMIAALLCAAPAGAAPPLKKEAPTGSRIAQTVEKDVTDSAEVRGIQARFGECVVKKQYAAARQWVLVPDIEGRERKRLFEKVADGWCLLAAAPNMSEEQQVAMRFPGDTMRHTLAETLVRRDLTTASLPGLARGGRYPQPTFDEAEFVLKPGTRAKPEEIARLAENRTKQLALVYLAEFGECVTRRNASDGLALIMAAPGSKAESAAFTRLLPAFGQCLAAGETLTFNKAVLRGTIAVNLYRLAYAPRIAVPAGAPRAVSQESAQ